MNVCRRTVIPELGRHALMVLILALVLFPFAMLIVLSFKDTAQFMHERWTLSFPLHLKNYVAATNALIGYAVNSFIVTGLTCFGVVSLSAFSAYVFARFDFPGRQFLFYAIISLMMIPGVLGLVPLFMIVKRLGLLDSYWALVLPYVAGGQVMGIFLLRTFFAAIPGDLFDASRIDGAGDFRTFVSVAVPLCRPMLATVAIITVLSSWNDLIWPLVVIQDNRLKTITIGLLRFQSQFVSQSVTQWGPLFAGYVVAFIPLLVLFLATSKTFVEGLTAGALKA